MNYEIYKSSRNASWKFLISHKVSELPIDIKSITKSMGITVRKDITGLLEPGEQGRTITTENEIQMIVRDMPIPQKRYTIMHEIGHLVLSHTTNNGIYTDDNEYQAERFAIDVLAPACVLWGLNLHTAEDIARACNISMTAAKRRAERMAVLYDRNMFLSHPLERQVFSQFKDFIDSQNK